MADSSRSSTTDDGCNKVQPTALVICFIQCGKYYVLHLGKNAFFWNKFAIHYDEFNEISSIKTVYSSQWTEHIAQIESLAKKQQNGHRHVTNALQEKMNIQIRKPLKLNAGHYLCGGCGWSLVAADAVDFMSIQFWNVNNENLNLSIHAHTAQRERARAKRYAAAVFNWQSVDCTSHKRHFERMIE